MNLDFALSSAGAFLCAFFALVLRVTTRKPGAPARWLALVFLEGAVYFVAVALEASLESELPGLILSQFSILYGLPAMYFFVRSALGDVRPVSFLHFLPAFAAQAAALVLAAFAIAGFFWVDSAAQILDSACWCGETIQLVAYGAACLRLLFEPRHMGKMRKSARTIALLNLASYAMMELWDWGLFLFANLSPKGAESFEPYYRLDLVFLLPLTAISIFILVTRPPFIQGEADDDADLSRTKYYGSPMSRTNGESMLARARAHLAETPDLSESGVTPRRLAEALGLPYHLLSRASNEVGGLTLSALIVEARLDRAERLLLETDRQILDIAFESGFAAKSSFNLAWKSKHGMTPSAWRKSRKPD